MVNCLTAHPSQALLPAAPPPMPSPLSYWIPGPSGALTFARELSLSLQDGVSYALVSDQTGLFSSIPVLTK